MLGTHVLDNRTGITSLKFQAYLYYGLFGYEKEMDPYMKIRPGENPKSENKLNLLFKAPIDKVLLYNGIDAFITFRLGLKHIKKLKKQNLWGSYKFFHDVILMFANVEQTGIRINKKYFRPFK